MNRIRLSLQFYVVFFVLLLIPTSGLSAPDEDHLLRQSVDSGELSSLGKPEGAKEDETKTLGLDKLLTRAVEREGFRRQYRKKIESARWRKYRADWARFPKLTTQTSLAPVPANADPDEISQNYDEIAALNIGPFLEQQLDVLVPLYTFGRIDNAQKLAEVGVDNEKIKRRRAMLDLFYQVKRAYFGLQLSTTLDDILSDGSQLLKDKLEDMQEARDFGTADFEIEDFRKLQLFDAELDTRRVDNQQIADVALEGMEFLTGVDKADVAVPQMETDGSLGEFKDKKYYLNFAYDNRPELIQLDKAVKARRLQRELAESELYPNLVLAGGLTYGWSTESAASRPVCTNEDGDCNEVQPNRYVRPFSNPLDRFSFNIGLGLQWKFDLPQQRGKLEQKRAQYQVILSQRRRARRAIELDVERLYMEATDARKKVEILKRKRHAAQRWKAQFGLSMQTAGAELKDAVDPLKEHFKAQGKYLKARFEYYMARASLAKAIGAKRLADSGQAKLGTLNEILNSS